MPPVPPLQTLSLDDLASAVGGRHAPRQLPPAPIDGTPGVALDPAPIGRTATSYRQPLRRGL